MTPLDLRTAPPRGPRATLAGLAFAARAVDKLRASLPGGECNGYLPFEGFSAVWAARTRVDLHALRDAIAAAERESEVEAWLRERTVAIERERFNAGLERAETAQIPEDMRAFFESLYPADLRERHALLFDLFEADDARTYGTR